MADCLQLIVLLTLDYTTKVKHMCSLATTTPYSMSWRQMWISIWIFPSANYLLGFLQTCTQIIQSHNFYLQSNWEHPCITSAKGLGGWLQKMAIFADIQYCIYVAHYLYTTSAKGLGGWGLFLLKFSIVFMLI